MADQLALIGLGFVLGAIVWDVLWRIVRRLDNKLITAQRELIGKQSHALDMCERILARREKAS